nr:3-deoxy-manno-octulosonate cytidylyltransferase, mitochondrial-like [Ipomoea batatas]
MQRTWERAKLARALDQVVVATDDEKIAECCRGFGAEVIMTSESCRNGTERCNEALQKLEKKYDIVVNIQGDEPLIEPEIIDGIVEALQVIKVDHEAHGVDAPEDVDKIVEFMRERNLS